MTLVSTIITDAYRESNIIPLVATPSTNQTTEALRRLNTLILSSVGNEVGDELCEINYGGDFDQTLAIGQWVPDNIRLILDLTATTTLNLDPYPYEGQRLAVNDVAGNLATYNLTLNGNGRLIEGSSSLVLSTNSEARQWLYRSDIGNWVRINELISSDSMPFPIEYDDFFVTTLAVRLNPRYGQSLSQETIQALTRARGQLRSRYRMKGYIAPSDPGLINPKDLYAYGYGQDQFGLGYLRPLG